MWHKTQPNHNIVRWIHSRIFDILLSVIECSLMARETRVQSQNQISEIILEASLLNTQRYKVWINGEGSNSRKGVALFPTHWCSSYWKRSPQFGLDYRRPTYLVIYTCIYISSSTSCRAISEDIPDNLLLPLPIAQGYNPYPQRDAVCRFELVALLLLGHMKGWIEVNHLGSRPYFSSSVQHV